MLYEPETIRIHPNEAKFTFFKYSIHVPDDILSTFLITPTLREEGLKLTHYTNVKVNERIRLEFINPVLKTFTLKKKKTSKIALFMTLNEGNDVCKTEFEKIDTN